MIMVGTRWFASKTDEDWTKVINASETLRNCLRSKEGLCLINYRGKAQGLTRGPKNGRYGEMGNGRKQDDETESRKR